MLIFYCMFFTLCLWTHSDQLTNSPTGCSQVRHLFTLAARTTMPTKPFASILMWPNSAVLVSSAEIGATPTVWLGRAATCTGKDFYLTERLFASPKGYRGAGLTKSNCLISRCMAVNSFFV